MKTNQELIEAISRSESHNEIVHVEVADKAAAYAAMGEACKLAEDACLESGVSDTNAGWDVWANAKDAADGDMVWRISISITAADEEAE